MQEETKDKIPGQILPDTSSQTISVPHPSRIHSLWVLFLIWFFPPYAWHNMWVHKKYHHWFSAVSLLNSLLLILPSSTYIFITYPKLAALSQTLPVPIQAVYPLVAFAILEFAYGIFLKKEVSIASELPRFLLWPTIVIFTINYILTMLITPIAIPLLNNPLFDLISKINYRFK